MKNFLITTLLLLGFAISANAQQYTVDFINDDPNGADPNNERGVDDGTILEFDGVYLMFSATSTSGEGYAYFDKGTAGLGVCTTTVATQCSPTSDDNLTLGETLTLSVFSDADGQNPLDVTLGNIVFRDANHNLINDQSTILFGVDGGGLVSTSMLGFGWSDMGSSFTFGYDRKEYYISSMLVSEIPEPATWLMMIIGFGIVSAATRRSRRTTSIAHTC